MLLQRVRRECERTSLNTVHSESEKARTLRKHLQNDGWGKCYSMHASADKRKQRDREDMHRRREK